MPDVNARYKAPTRRRRWTRRNALVTLQHGISQISCQPADPGDVASRCAASREHGRLEPREPDRAPRDELPAHLRPARIRRVCPPGPRTTPGRRSTANRKARGEQRIDGANQASSQPPRSRTTYVRPHGRPQGAAVVTWTRLGLRGAGIANSSIGWGHSRDQGKGRPSVGRIGRDARRNATFERRDRTTWSAEHGGARGESQMAVTPRCTTLRLTSGREASRAPDPQPVKYWASTRASSAGS